MNEKLLTSELSFTTIVNMSSPNDKNIQIRFEFEAQKLIFSMTFLMLLVYSL